MQNLGRLVFMVVCNMAKSEWDPTYLSDDEIKALKAGEKLKAKAKKGRPVKVPKDVPFVSGR